MAGRPPREAEEIVVAYGFDRTGLSIPPAVQHREYHIRWAPYGSPDIPDDATGIIFPSGIFERVDYHHDFLGGRVAEVRSDRGNLLALERYVANLLRAGGWVAILVREIVDEFPSGRYQTYRADNTDLAKRLLNGFPLKRTAYPEGTAMVGSKRDEFTPYIKRWGIARTIFEVEDRARVLARAGDAVVGFEYDARLFILPFHSSSTSPENSREIAESLVRAVIDYRRKMLIELPPWTGEFQFLREQGLRDEFAVLQERLLQVESDLKSWEQRKVILVGSGTVLKEALVNILKGFFGLDVDPIDEGREDFKIIDAKTIVCVGEAKGTNGGIKRDHINQVDSHRERLGLTDAVPGLLVINNQMDVPGIAKRRATQVPPEQVRHARRMNVLIVRTIDLLFLMRHLEGDADKRGQFIALIRGGGGWLDADSSKYRIVTGEKSE